MSDPPKVTPLPIGEDARSRLRKHSARGMSGAPRPGWARKLGTLAQGSCGVCGIPSAAYTGAGIACAAIAALKAYHDEPNTGELLAAGVLLLLGYL